MLRGNVNTRFVIYISSGQGRTKVANKMYSEMTQRDSMIRVFRGETRGFCEDMEECVVFFGREEGDLSASTVQGIKNINTRKLRGGTIMNRAPTGGIWVVYKDRSRHGIQCGRR